MKPQSHVRCHSVFFVLVIISTLLFTVSCGGLQNQVTGNNPQGELFSSVITQSETSNADISTPATAASPKKTGVSTATTPVQTSTFTATLESTSIPLPASGDWQITANTLSYVQLLSQVKLAPLGEVKSLVWSPDGKLLAAAGDSGTVLIDGEKLEIIRELGTQARYSSLSFSADGNRLVAAGIQSTVQVWDLNNGKTIHVFPLAGEHVALSPDGQKLVAVGEEIENIVNDTSQIKVVIKIFNVDTGKLLNTFSYTSGMPGWFYPQLPRTIGVFFSNDGQKLLTANDLGDVRMWSVANGKLLGTSINADTRTRYSTGICQASSTATSPIWIHPVLKRLQDAIQHSDKDTKLACGTHNN
jgi:WD40 repeat protein